MANLKIYGDGEKNSENDHIKYLINRALQSSHINFLIGSGASVPAINLGYNVEKIIISLYKDEANEDAEKAKCNFIWEVQEPTNLLLNNPDDSKVKDVLKSYRKFIKIIEQILIDRKTNLLAKQANIFTSNYDLFIEKAAEAMQILQLNDGFKRIPNLKNEFEFSPEYFFSSIYNRGNLYNYQVEIPIVNLVKIHGSLSWKKDPQQDKILYDIQKRDKLSAEDIKSEQRRKEYLKQYAIVLPQRKKFYETVMDRYYYDLLRMYSNELDRENTLLIVFGFSFEDDHIRDITQRALKNPTLKMLIIAYQSSDIPGFEDKFNGYDNVDIICPSADKKIDFEKFNEILAESIHMSKKELKELDETQ